MRICWAACVRAGLPPALVSLVAPGPHGCLPAPPPRRPRAARAIAALVSTMGATMFLLLLLPTMVLPLRVSSDWRKCLLMYLGTSVGWSRITARSKGSITWRDKQGGASGAARGCATEGVCVSGAGWGGAGRESVNRQIVCIHFTSNFPLLLSRSLSRSVLLSVSLSLSFSLSLSLSHSLPALALPHRSFRSLLSPSHSRSPSPSPSLSNTHTFTLPSPPLLSSLAPP